MKAPALMASLDAAAARIRRTAAAEPLIGLVLGSGLGAFAERLTDRTAIPYTEIPRFPASTGVVGHAGELVLGRVGKTPVAVLSGRVHFYEGHSMADVVFPARVLARLGVKAVVLTNAAGGVRLTFKPGDLMVITDHINFFGHHPLIGRNEEKLGPRFPDMSFIYDPELRRILKATGRAEKIPLREGVYLGTSGPSYETPAEIRAFRRMGADAVGMSTVPEAIALRHAGVRVAGISTITNMAAGILEQPLEHGEVLETTRRVGDRFVRLLTKAIPRLAKALK
ncbi:MAG: purine-nucleoside phosphorylase [Thermoanaerobaculia bacterium]|nr:purine-nucleoside phosphorylase [Acidobacteriota bacterium]